MSCNGLLAINPRSLSPLSFLLLLLTPVEILILNYSFKYEKWKVLENVCQQPKPLPELQIHISNCLLVSPLGNLTSITAFPALAGLLRTLRFLLYLRNVSLPISQLFVFLIPTFVWARTPNGDYLWHICTTSLLLIIDITTPYTTPHYISYQWLRLPQSLSDLPDFALTPAAHIHHSSQGLFFFLSDL